ADRSAYPSIADRVNAGTSTGARTSAAATRPIASRMAIRSMRSMGLAAAIVRASASSKGITCVNRSGRTLLLQFPRQVPDLRDDEFGHRKANGGFGSGQDEDGRCAGDARRGAREHGARADVAEAQHAEQFAEPREGRVEGGGGGVE